MTDQQEEIQDQESTDVLFKSLMTIMKDTPSNALIKLIHISSCELASRFVEEKIEIKDLP